ncbi:MAG: hypothetical protein ACI8S6_005346 [Myxococcota bacterium]|jgi:hypothetical protein
MSSRRNLLKMMGLTAAATAVPVAAAAAGDLADRRAVVAALTADGNSGQPWWLLSPLTVGASVGLGWQVAALSSVERGAAVLSLSHRDGRDANVHLCAHAGRPRGLAHTALFDLILMDGGQGDQPTDEGLGRALKNLSARIRRNEISDRADLRPLAHMMTHAERVELYGAETLA